MFDTDLPLLDEDHLRTITEKCRYSTAIYLIANSMWKKYGKSRLCEVLKLFNRGLNMDLNMAEIVKARLEQEKDKKEEAAKTLKLLDGSMAEAYRDLATVLRDHDIWYRECILTSFSLVPSHSLLYEIDKCADRANALTGEDAEKLPLTTNGVGEEEGVADESLSSDAIIAWDTFEPSKDMDKFNDYCQALETSLQTVSFSKGCAKLKKDGTKPPTDSTVTGIQTENTLDGLLSIEGSVLTSSLTYDPLADPMSAFCMNEVPMKLISDLLIVVNSPRWHLLSWVHPWKVQ